MPIDEPGKTRELGLLLDRILFPLVRVSRPLAHLVLWVLSRFPLGLTKWSFLQDLTSPADHRLFADADPRQDLDFILEALRGRAGIVHDFVLVGAPWGFDPSELSCPCDIWRGTEDKIVPEVHAHWLAGRISQHRFHLVENCGHFLLRLKGEEVLRELIRG